jgi:hypothetical protein
MGYRREGVSGDRSRPSALDRAEPGFAEWAEGDVVLAEAGVGIGKTSREGKISRRDRTWPIVWSRHLYWVHADDPKATAFLVAHGSMDAACGMLSAAALVVVESLGVVVEVFFGPRIFENALIGPADVVPAVAA